jgi:hypothetical protein
VPQLACLVSFPIKRLLMFSTFSFSPILSTSFPFFLFQKACFFNRELIGTQSVYGSTALVEVGRLFQFLNQYTVGRTLWTEDQPVARPLPTHRTTQTQNKRTQYIHPSPEWDSNLRSQCSCLRSRGHCDRLIGTLEWQIFLLTP